MKEKVERTSEENELDASQWSVVSASERAASGLTYAAAVKFVEQMSNSIPGLCIVTDRAANRLYLKQRANNNRELSQVSLPNTFAETL